MESIAKNKRIIPVTNLKIM